MGGMPDMSAMGGDGGFGGLGTSFNSFALLQYLSHILLFPRGALVPTLDHPLLIPYPC